MPRNIAIHVAYDGTEFHGWQTQPGFRTVQETLREAIQRAVRHPVDLTGSGRTDSGVHALGQVANFRTDSSLSCGKLQHSIGSRLPDDVAIFDLCDVSPAFHATHSAIRKLYRYRIWNSTRRPVEHLLHRYVYHYWRPLDAGAMADAAAYFVGEMDFSAMTAAGGERDCMVRTVFRCAVQRDSDEIRIDVEGDGFLYRQVRNMVGTLLHVGRGFWKPHRVAEIIASRDRAHAGPTAPAHGLVLHWVRYPPELCTPSADSPPFLGLISNNKQTAFAPLTNTDSNPVPPL